MTSAVAQRAPGALRLEGEARALYAALSDGHDGLGFHVSRGCALRVAGTGQPIVSSEVPRGAWRPARDLTEQGEEVDRHFNPYVLRQHLLGNYDVAIESPSWTSLVTFDIDRHLPGHADEDAVDFRLVAEANQQRDAVLAALWRAFSFGSSRLPVIQKTPSGGYHVSLAICRGADGEHTERTWPADWLREHICDHLWAAGLELRPGRLELFPSGCRLRAPCGRGMLLMTARHPDRPEALELEPAAGTWRPHADRALGAFRPVRKVAPMVRAYLAELEASRRPLEAWLGGEAALWHPVRGPFRSRKTRPEFSGVSALSRHIGEVQAAASADPASDPDRGGGGWLLRGPAFRARIRSLLHVGLTQAGTRHDAVLKLIWFWAVVGGAPRVEVEQRLRAWLAAHDHASHLRARSVRAFVAQSVREGMHYFDHVVMPMLGGTAPRRGGELALAPLAEVDRRVVLGAVRPEVQREAAVLLAHLAAQADATGRVPGQVLLSGAVLEGLVGERRVAVEEGGAVQRRRAAVVARDELARLGVLALAYDYSTGRHGRLYTCWYRFGSGVVASRCAQTGARILGRREVPEGVLEIVAAGPGEKFPHARVRKARAAEGGGRRWWIRLYERRHYTPGELFSGDAAELVRARRRWAPPVTPHQVGARVVAALPRAMGRTPPPPVQADALERAMAAAFAAWSVANDDRGPP